MREMLHEPTDPTEFDRMYIETLNAIGIPEVKWQDMIEKETHDKKWTLIVQNKERVISGDVLAQKCVDLLKCGDLQIAEIRELRTIIGTSPKVFLEKFYQLGGLEAMKLVLIKRGFDYSSFNPLYSKMIIPLRISFFFVSFFLLLSH